MTILKKNTVARTKEGFYYRPETTDLNYFAEARNDYKIELHRTDRVLDIGGCIGTYAILCIQANVRAVLSIEPIKESFTLLNKNTRHALNSIPGAWTEVRALHGAATAGLQSTVEIFVNPDSRSTGAPSAHRTRRGSSVVVSAYRMKTLLDDFKPTVVKVDCEGSEYELLAAPLPKFVKAVCLEYHAGTRAFRDEAPMLHERLSNEFGCIHEPRFTPSWRVTTASYER